jgi:hypothetical protein
MRGSWARKCLEVYGRRVIDRAETTDGVASGRELGKWTSDLLTVIEVSSLRRRCNETKANPGPAGGVRSSRSARSAPKPITSSFYLRHSSDPFDYPLQYNPIFLLNPDPSALNSIHFPHARFLLVAVSASRWMRRAYNLACRAEGERARYACQGV